MKYLASFVRRSFYYNFCLGELKSLAEIFGKKLEYDINYSFNSMIEPFIKIHFNDIEKSEIAQKI